MALSSTDPKVLMGQAKCFNCLTPHQQLQDQTYLLATIAKFATTAAGVRALAAASNCFSCLTIFQLKRVKQYLLATWLGLDTSVAGVQALIKAAACVTCLTPRQQQTVETYLLAVTAGAGTNAAGVQAIEAAAACFDCPTTKQQYEFQVYILAQLANVTSTAPADLVSAARCFISCLPFELEEALQASLIIQTASQSTTPCSTPSHPFLVQVAQKGVTDPNTQLSVRWQQLGNAGGTLITGYIVYWGTTSGGPYTNNSGVLPANPKQYIISGLTTGTTYYAVVQAVTQIAGCVSTNSAEANGTPGGAPVICADGITYTTITWQANVTANAATTPSAAVQAALEAFYCGLQTDGTLNSILWLQLMVPGAVGAVTDNAGGRALAGTAFIFVKGTTGLGGGSSPLTAAGFLDIQGVTGNFPASSFYDTGFNPSTAFASSQSAGWFIYATSPSKTGYSFGVFASPGNNFSGLAQFTDGNAYSAIGVTGTNNVVVASPGRGFYSGQRVSNVDHRLYFANEATAFGQIGATDAIAFNGVLPNANAYIWAEDTIGTGAQTPSQDQLHAVGYTTGLSSASVQLIYNRLRKLLLDLGVSLTNGFLNSLVSYWRIDGAITNGLFTDYQDSNNLTTGGGVSNGSGGPFAATGYFGNGGTDVIASTPANLRLGAGKSFTLQLWYLVGANPANLAGIAASYDNTQAGSAFAAIFVAAGTLLQFTCYASDGSSPSITTAWPAAGWHHFIFGYDASTKTVFMQVDAGARVTTVSTADLHSSTAQFSFNTATGLPAANGGIAQAAFWSRALSTTEVTTLYNSGKGVPFGAFTV